MSVTLWHACLCVCVCFGNSLLSDTSWSPKLNSNISKPRANIRQLDKKSFTALGNHIQSAASHFTMLFSSLVQNINLPHIGSTKPFLLLEMLLYPVKFLKSSKFCSPFQSYWVRITIRLILFLLQIIDKPGMSNYLEL